MMNGVRERAGADQLADDPEERNNLANQFPQRVRSMTELALQQVTDIETDAIPLGGPADSRANHSMRGRWLK